MDKKVTTKFKIAGFIGMGVGILLIILACTVFAKPAYNLTEGFPKPPTGFPDKDIWMPRRNNYGVLFLGVTVCMLSVAALVTGFKPEIFKLKANIANETLNVAGDNISKVANKAAQVVSPAITTVSQSIKTGFEKSTNNGNNNNASVYENSYGTTNSQNVGEMYCKNCGKLISTDSKFCKHCGGTQ